MGVFAVMVASFLGCSTRPRADYSQLGLVQISGTITLDGQPVAGAAIFLSAPDESYSYGVTNAQGRYTMMLNSEKSGVIPGEKRVEISTARHPLGEAAETGAASEEVDPDGQPSLDSQERIPACYNALSTLRVTITRHDSRLDFHLTSDCAVARESL